MQEVKYKVEYIDIDKLQPHKDNPRFIKDEDFNSLCISIKDNPEYFETRPIICDTKFVIWAGNMRWRGAKHVGMKAVPTVVLDLPEEKLREIMIRDNVQNGKWDVGLLASMFKEAELEKWGMDLSEFGVFGEESDPKDDEVPEKQTETTTKLGDIFELGKHRIMCGSSTSEEDIDKLMDGSKAKLIFSSPPYNMGADLYNTYEDNLASEKYIDFNIDVVNKYKKYLAGFLFWNISYNKNTRSEFIEIMYRIIKETGLEFLELIVWNKKHAMPIQAKDMMTRQYEDILVVGDPEAIKEDMEMFVLTRNHQKAYFSRRGKKSLTNYWEVDTNNTQTDTHGACFPVALPVKGISIMTKEGDIVIDPFLGSGTTLIASEKTGRTCYGMELDPHYVDVCVKRWEEFTGLKAKKL